MGAKKNFQASILMISSHGYVSAQPELGKLDTGGQVVYVLELGRSFSRLGYRVDLVTRRFENQPESDEIDENFRVWRIPFGGEDFIRKEDMHEYLDEFVANFLWAARSQGIQYDVVWSHYWDAGWAGQQIAEELRIPHIHTPHSLGWWKRHNMKGDPVTDEKLYRFEERIHKESLMYHACDHVIATTEQQATLLQEQYGLSEGDITVIPPGIDEDRFFPVRSNRREELRQRYGLRAHDVLTVGRLAENKGYDLLIEAMPTLLGLVPDARLIAAIGGEDSGLKAVAKQAGVADKVVWIQVIPAEDLANYYRAVGIFALSSRYEPFGMVAIEAMACGTPTVVTVHGGLFELVNFGTQALYADPTRPVEYGTMLALPLLYPRLAEKLSVQGARFSRRNFGWTGIARRILAIFDQFRVKRIERGLK